MTSAEYLLLPTQAQLVSRLRQLIGFSSSFVFLTGSKGSGRTVISQLLMNELDANHIVSHVRLQPDMDILRIREAVVLQFVPTAVFDPSDHLAETLHRLVPDLSVPRLLIVDDADCSASDWVSELWQWLKHQDEVHPLHKISVLLIGTSEFSERLAQHLKGRDQMALEIEIEPLTQKEQKKLLVNCLQDGEVSAAQGEQALTRLAHCQGKPGEVVAIAEACMDKKSLSSLKTTIPVNKLIAGVAVLAGVVLLLSWIVPSLSDKESSTATPPVTQPERQEVALQPNTSAAVVAPEGVVPASGAVPAVVTQDGIVSGAETVAIDAESATDDSGKRRVVISDQAVRQMASNQPVTGVVEEQPLAQTSGAVTSLNQLSPVVNEIKGNDSSAVIATTESVSAAKETVTAEKKVKHKARVVTEHKAVKKTPAVKPASVASASVKKTTETKKAATTVAGSGYALQLAASGNPSALKKLAATNGVSSKAQIYKNQSTGMYVLVYGQYTSSAAAKAAVSRLPAALKNTNPWPKSYAQIKKEQGK